MARVPHSPANPSSNRDWVQFAGRATWCVLGLFLIYSLCKTIGQTEDFQDLDFGAYYRGGQAVARGETPYRLDEHGPMGAFVYSPAFACVYRSFCLLDYIWAARLWMLVNFAICVGCVLLAVQLVWGNDRRNSANWAVVWLTLLATGSYYLNNFRAGQAGALVVVFCLGWAVCQRHGRPFLGGVLLAAAVAVKLSPAILLPYLLLRKDWRGLFGAAVGGVALLALPSFWVGWEGSIRLHREWAQFCASTQIPEQTFRTENQSLLGELARLPAISNGETCFSPERLHSLEQAYPIVLVVLTSALYGGLFWHLRKYPQRFTLEEACCQDNLHLALLMILMTLAHPRAWTSNFVALTLPCLMAAVVVTRRAPRWPLSLATLLLMASACATPKVHPAAGQWSFGVWVLQGKDFWSAVVLAGASCWSAVRQMRLARLTVVDPLGLAEATPSRAA